MTIKPPDSLDTEFAPAEIIPLDAIQTQHKHFADLNMVKAFLDAFPDVFIVLNEQRQIVFSNDAMVNVAHAPSEDEILGQRLGNLLLCKHALGPGNGCGTTEFCRTCGAVKAMLAGLSGKRQVEECRIGTVDGDALDFRVWSTPIQVDGERFTMLSVKDISDEKRRRVLERLFFHDVLNTAGIVMGFSRLLDMNTEDSEQRALLDTLLSSAQRLVDEIRTQRDLSAAENDELAPHYEALNSIDLLIELKLQYSMHSVAESHEIRIAQDSAQFSFVSDRLLLGRVVGNMIKNALEASQPGDVVTIAAYQQDGEVIFCVHNPQAMPRNVQLQMFKRSFTTKGAGRGLGTYSMKLLSERYLGGSVDFTSTTEQGTTFTARYPQQPQIQE